MNAIRVGVLSLLLSYTFVSAADSPVTRTLERGPHHRVVERYVQRPYKGSIIDQRIEYTELQNGMHYLDNGEWRETEERIEIAPNGASATHGHYKVVFSGNFTDPGSVQIQLPNEHVQKFNLVGLVARNALTGEQRIIAEVKAANGFITAPNEVTYKDVFDGIACDVRYTYRKGSFEQDIILYEEPLLPRGWALDDVHIEAVTEIVEGPDVVATTVMTHGKHKGRGVELVDQSLLLDPMLMVQGKAFTIVDPVARRGDVPSTPVFKRLETIEGRRILFETVPFSEMRPMMRGLKLPVQARPRAAADQPSLPRKLNMKRDAKPLQVAAGNTVKPGVVIDYVIVDPADPTINVNIFLADQTYHVLGHYHVTGSAQVQAGTVVKFGKFSTYTSSLIFDGTVTFPTAGRRPIFTHELDNRMGAFLGGGTPGVDWDETGVPRYTCAIEILGPSTATVQRVDIRHAITGIKFSHAGSFNVTDVILEKCTTGIEVPTPATTTVTLQQILMLDVGAQTSPTLPNSCFAFPPGEAILTSGGAPGLTEQGQPIGAVGLPFDSTWDLTVNATGFGLYYQWYKNGVSMAGKTTKTLHFHRGDRWEDHDIYYCRVWNDFGWVKTKEVPFHCVLLQPEIIVQPKSQSVPSGTQVRFFVEARGGAKSAYGNYAYQWFKNNVAIVGATNFEMTDNSAAGAQFFCRVTDVDLNTTTDSNPATLTIVAPANKTFSGTGFTGQKINLDTSTGVLAPIIAAKPLNYINVPASTRGSIVRVDTTTGLVVGEYLTAPPETGYQGNGFSPDPSRTTVDKYGNIWVGNRRDQGGTTDLVESPQIDDRGRSFFGTHRSTKGSIARFGIVIGGTRGKRNPNLGFPFFKPDPTGEYLKGPFIYSTCIDRDNDGLIRTSGGVESVIPWGRALDLFVKYDPVEAETDVWVADQDAGIKHIYASSAVERTPREPQATGKGPFPASLFGKPLGLYPLGDEIFVVGEKGVSVMNPVSGPNAGIIASEDFATGKQGFAVRAVDESPTFPSDQHRAVYTASTSGLISYKYDLAPISITKLETFVTPGPAFDLEVVPYTLNQNRVTRLAPNGAPDVAFSATGVNSTVNAVAIAANSKIIVGGAFTQVGATVRNRLARLQTDGSLDTTFAPSANNIIYAVAVESATDKVFAGGAFTQVGSAVNRGGIAKFDANGNVDPNFQNGMSGANSTVRCIAIQNDGKILIGGLFTTVNGSSYARVARLLSNGALDPAFVNPAIPNGQVNAIAIQNDGRILIGGTFTFTDGKRSRIARLFSNGTLDTSFLPGTSSGANNTVNSILVASVNGAEKILVGGAFTLFNSSSRAALVELETTAGNIEGSFAPFSSGSPAGFQVMSIALQNIGILDDPPSTERRLIIGGTFTQLDGLRRQSLVRLNFNGDAQDGTIDNSFVGSLSAAANALAVNPTTARIVAGGVFTQFSTRLAYVVGKRGAEGFFQIVDVSRPTQPALIGEITNDTQNENRLQDIAYSVQLSGQIAWVANGAKGVKKINISNPTLPVVELTLVNGTITDPLDPNFDPTDQAFDVEVVGNFAYVAERDKGLRVYNMTNPSMIVAARLNTPSPAIRLKVLNNRAYIAESYSGLDIIDVTTPLTPKRLGSCGYAGDEALLNYIRVEQTFVRHVSVDKDNNIWVGGTENGRVFEKYRGELTKQDIDANISSMFLQRFPAAGNPPVNFGGYGGFIDGRGILWSSSGFVQLPAPGMEPNKLLKMDTTDQNMGFFNYEPSGGIDDYGLAIDPADQAIYHTQVVNGKVAGYANTSKTAPSGANVDIPYGFLTSQGCVVDNNRNLWVAHQLNNSPNSVGSQTIGHVKLTGTPTVPAGDWTGNVELDIARSLPLPNGQPVGGATGVAVDSYDKIWSVNFDACNLMRINPTNGPIGKNDIRVGAVDLKTDLDRGQRVARATATISMGQVTAVKIDDAGWFYASAPPVTFTGGGASMDATGVAVVSNGRVIGVTITNPGIGYTTAPTVALFSEFTPTQQRRSEPYSYSDMTGFVLLNSTSPGGMWNTVYDGGNLSVDWKKIDWTSTEPANSSIIVHARAANTEAELGGKPFSLVSKNVLFSGTMVGRFIEVRVTFTRDWIYQPTSAANPSLSSMTIYRL